MTFNSLQYAAFLPLVVLLHWLLPRRLRLPFLLIASYLFYGAWDYRFLSLLFISTIVDYSIGIAMGRSDRERRRRLLLLASLFVNLGILGFFKYFNFFVESAGALLANAGFEPNLPLLRVVLPVGISFYTFQTLSYTFDVFRRSVEPCRDFIAFATYVAYFPQLVAGPIERARRLLPRLQAERVRPDAEQVRSALGLIVFGLFKKVVLADQMAPFVDGVFTTPSDATGLEVAAGAVAFAIQIYGDFSGYTDIARGSSRLLSVDLMVNFRQPYLSRNITEFWRRWHISLSSWLREYLYVPLGGNRGSRVATYRNLMTTMVLGGLWHGAAWTFVAWGAMHGALLSIDRALGGQHRSMRDRISAIDVPRIAVTFALVCIAWIFFRGTSIGESMTLIEGLVTWRGPTVFTPQIAQVVLWLIVMVGIDVAARRAPEDAADSEESERSTRPRPVLAGVLSGIAVTLIVLFSGSESVPFIYFQF